MQVYVFKENGDNRACLLKGNINGSCFWTSGQRVNESCQSSFVWKPSSGKTLPLKFQAWTKDEPNCLDSNEFCLDLQFYMAGLASLGTMTHATRKDVHCASTNLNILKQ